jgi:GR25 family glycosyltransferase involved in LPS biosynthesis
MSSYLVDRFIRESARLLSGKGDFWRNEMERFSKIVISICQELGDGEGIIRVAYRCSSLGLSSVSRKVSNRPTVARVINLERRKDRMEALLARVLLQSGVVVVKGVIPPKYWRSGVGDDLDNHLLLKILIGSYAFDGSAEKKDEDNSSQRLCDPELNSLVRRQWRPNDIKNFDDFASDDRNFMVSLSLSERACAFSHISAWKGIALTLPRKDFSATEDGVMPFTWSGYARGPRMFGSFDGSFDKSHAVPSVPVALVLEDDAILVDRFAERLDELLEELPIDFHYCAIGYGRPKTAPLVDTSPPCEHIKLPTMTWYLTGYLLSGEGARYLLSQLPVEGPVDTWIGRLILEKNWGNEYGSRVGIGGVSRVGKRDASSDEKSIVSRTELQSCLKFRAFCATIPLCSQKVGQQWQQRDTDIVYSGK